MNYYTNRTIARSMGKDVLIGKETKKKIVLLLTSTILSAIIIGIAAEAFLNYRYEQWRSNYRNNGDWYAGITTVSANPSLMWEYRPNAESNKPDIPTIRTNRYGFRDYDYPTPAKPKGVFRIGFIGDSLVLGLTVDRESTFVAKFERYAKGDHSHVKIQSMNFGIDGYNIKQISELLASRVLRFNPDTIVYVMSLNDFDYEESSGGKIRYFDKPNSFILEKLERLYRRLLKIDFHVWYYRKYKRDAFDKIIEMQQLLHEENVEFQIVLLPVFEIRNPGFTFADYLLSNMHSEIERVMATNKIKFFDLLQAFRNQEKPPIYFANDEWHPNEEGHDFIAKQLERIVLEDTNITFDGEE